MEKKWRVVQSEGLDGSILLFRVEHTLSDGSWWVFAYRHSLQAAKELIVHEKSIDNATETVVYEA